MNKQYKITLFFILVIVEIYIDTDFTRRCNSIIGELLNIAHHIYACLLFLPFLHELYKVHIVIIILTTLSWYLRESCLLTEIVNSFCKTPNRKFKTIFNHFIMKHFSIPTKYVSYKTQKAVMLFLLLLFSIYKVIK